MRGTRADKVGAETAPKHAPWKGGFRLLRVRIGLCVKRPELWSDFIDVVSISEFGGSFPMFYLHGKAEGCAPVSTLLQTVLFHVHPGTYLWLVNNINVLFYLQKMMCLF